MAPFLPSKERERSQVISLASVPCVVTTWEIGVALQVQAMGAAWLRASGSRVNGKEVVQFQTSSMFGVKEVVKRESEGGRSTPTELNNCRSRDPGEKCISGVAQMKWRPEDVKVDRR